MPSRRELLTGVAASTLLMGMSRPEQLLLLGGGTSSGPSLDLNFLNGTLDSRIAFTRASIGTYYDSTGTMQTAASGAARFDYGPTPGGVTNWVSNSTMVGAVAPTTVPTNWGAMDGGSGGAVNGITATIVGTGTENGLPYLDVAYAGTATLTANLFQRFTSSSIVPAAPGQTWTTSLYVKLVSGSLNGATTAAFIGERGAAGNNIGANTLVNYSPTGASLSSQRISGTYTNINALCQFELGAVGVGFTNTLVYNFTLRVGAPQLEQNTSASAWVPTSGAAANVGAVPLGLLIEEARTNSIRNSTAAGAVVGTPGTLPTNWVNTSAAGLTVNVIGTGTENGISYIDLQWTGTTSSTAGNLAFDAITAIAAAQNQTWTSSFYYRLVGGALTNITALQVAMFSYTAGSAFISASQVAVASPTSAPLATQRVSSAWTIPDATAAFVRPLIAFTCNNTSAVNFTLRIGLPQAEQGAFATSAVPTSSVAVARALDAASMSQTSWLNTSAGTLEAEAIIPASISAQNSEVVSLGASGSDALILRTLLTSGSAQAVSFVANANKGSTSTANGAGSNTTFKSALTYTSATLGVSVVLNGSAIVTGVVTGLPVLTPLVLGAGRGAPLNGYLRRTRYWPRVLANSVLIAATSGDAPSLDLDFVNSTTLDPRITFTRASAGTYFDATGTMQTAASGAARFDYGPTPGGVTNWVRNSTIAGAVAGSPGTNPTNWNISGLSPLSSSVIATGTEGGIPYVDIRISGTSGTSQHIDFYFDANTTAPAALGQTWTVSAYLKLVAGSFANTTVGMRVDEFTSGAGFVGGNNNGITPSGAALNTQRYAFTYTVGGTTTSCVNGAVICTFTNTSAIDFTIRIGAPQLEQAAAASAWIPTSGAAVNIGAVPKGLLIEEARTNSIRNSTEAGAVAGTPGTLPTNWTTGNLGTLSQQVVGTGTENGIAFIDIRFSGTTSTTFAFIQPEQAGHATAAQNQVWALSSYVRLVGGSLTNVTNLQLVINEDNGGFLVSHSVTFTPTSAALATQRQTLASTLTNASTTDVYPTLSVVFSSGVAIDATLRIGLPQIEQGGFATSAIQTSSVAVTRAGDVANMSADTSWFSGGFAPGTMGVEYLPEFAGTVATSVHALTISDAGTTNRYCLRSKAGATATAASLIVSGGGAVGSGTLLTDVVGTVSKLAMAWSGGAVQNSVGNAGTVQATTAAAPVATLTTVGIGNLGSGFFSCGWTRRTRYWPRMMPNTELQSVTT